MPVAIAASVVGLIVALIAYYRDAPIEERRLEAPSWDVLPDPAEVARTEFPLAFPGYEPATVEFHFDLLARAYADLLAVAPPDVIDKARHRAAMRQGIDLPMPAATTERAERAVPPARSPAPVPSGNRSSLSTPTSDTSDLEALRAEAALADLDARPPDQRT